MLKIISIISIIIISAILLLQIDDELNPEIEQFLAQAKVTGTSEAYLYLMGIDAATDKNPSEVGKQLFELLKQNEACAFNDIEYYMDTADEKKLALPTSELFCSGWETDCFDTISSTNADLTEILLNNATLLERYQTFTKITDYQTLTKPATMIFPPYQYLAKGNRLVILKAIHTSQSSDYTQATGILMDNISDLRQHLKSADNLIGKMIYTALISHNLNALSLLIQQQKIAFEHQIASISLDERNLETVMAREFAISYDLLTNLDRKPGFFAQTTGEDSQMTTPGWLVRAVFKPNISINAVYPLYKNVVEKSQLEPKEFALAMDNAEVFHPQTAYIRNVAGTILMDISEPNFERYIARLFDLNVKIAIFNQTASKTELPDDLNYIQNPYYETTGTASYSEDGKNICLTGPLEDNRNQRCLRMKI